MRVVNRGVTVCLFLSLVFAFAMRGDRRPATQAAGGGATQARSGSRLFTVAAPSPASASVQSEP
jgi:hypothetical protein